MRTPRPTIVRRAAGVLGLVSAIGYLAIEAIAAARVPGYSYADTVVSDLGRPASPLSWWMNAAFRVQGMAFVILGTVLVATTRPARGGLTFTVFACAYGAGSVVVGLVPSGGSHLTQLLHVAGATAAIVGGNLALITAGAVRLPGPSTTHRALGYAVGGLGLASAAALVGSDVPQGAFERAAIYSIIAWQLVTSVALVLSRGRADDRRADERTR
ncbi:DUF998 domain-containing protein [Mycolicibacterium sp. 3033]|nr:DUF998 domain-containing protein [Mycolicibacterium aurantiacum]